MLFPLLFIIIQMYSMSCNPLLIKLNSLQIQPFFKWPKIVSQMSISVSIVYKKRYSSEGGEGGPTVCESHKSWRKR